MADEDLSQRLRDEIGEVEKLLEQAQHTFDRVRLDVEHLKDRLKALKDLAAALDRDEKEH